MSFTEDNYEKAVITLFEQMGYTHLYGPDIERDYYVPFYEEQLMDSLLLVNREKPRTAIQEAIAKLKDIETGSLTQKNELFMDYLQHGIEVSYFDGKEQRNDIVYLVDYDQAERNDFKIVNQWTFVEHSEKRADIILFINGLPLVVMELKSPSREETDASEAYLQLRNYMQEIPSLFVYNVFCVMSDMACSKAGTITSKEDRYMEWKTKDGDYESTDFADYDTFFEGIFQKERLLDIIKNFVCFSKDEAGSAKILAGYHQYFAVKKAIERTKIAVQNDGKIGVFWHTQGSGKSLSMVFYAHLLQDKLSQPTIVVITDRNDLDDQLYTQFAKCKDFLRQEPVQAKSREDLKSLLAGREANGIIFTTMQKFEESAEPLSLRKNIVVMTDEAHRGQYGFEEKIRMTKNEKGEEIAKRVIGTARIIHDCLPNASYIGFTGTPISTKDRDTVEVFGNYIDVYDMTQAVADGATCPVYYESRVVNLNLDETTLKAIDDEYDLLAEEGATEEQIEKSKREMSHLEEILGAPATIDSLCRDIVKHYEENRQYILTGKAMIVAYSRTIAMRIYDKLLELRKFLLLHDCDSILISALDEIAWLLNIRGEDIEYNPYVISYLYVSQSEAVWFAKKDDDISDPDTDDSFQELESDGISIQPYQYAEGILEDMLRTEDQKVFVEPSSMNYSLYKVIEDSVGEGGIKTGTSPVALWKSVKNDIEIAGMKEAFHEDGLAMEKFLFWLDTEVSSGKQVTEWEASVKLTSFRAAIPGYRGDSFSNISAYGPHAALPHYVTPESGSAVIEPRGLYLTDSGGQYLFGTTDITRTVPMGECSYLEKEDYTLVLKGMIALSRAIFPRGTAGCQLDVLARIPLWGNRRNFGHGTGHGVGFYLGVHEGPQDIRQNFNPQPLLPGMVTSDEPGIYREGQHGVRHENILLCVEAGSDQFAEWLGFETLTLCHIDTSAIIRDLLTAEEAEWINCYNRHVFEELSPELDEDTAAWLRYKTRPI